MSGAVSGARRPRLGRQAAQPRRRPRQRGHADRQRPAGAGPRPPRRTASWSRPGWPPTRAHRRGPRHRRRRAARRPLLRTRHRERHPVTSASTTREPTGSFFDQPRAVWAVAFACVIAFMGIGLVDPILKPIADQLDATPSQVSLLFTSYMAVMGVAMLITGVVSSRIGAKRTLLTGLRADHRLLRPGRVLRHRRPDRRLPRGLGPGQRAVHRHRPVHHRDVRARLDGAGDHPVRGRARPRHRRRPAASAASSARSPGVRRSTAWPS